MSNFIYIYVCLRCLVKTISILDGCHGGGVWVGDGGWADESVPDLTVWNPVACRVMSDGDPEERSFLSTPQTLLRFSLLHTFHFCMWIFNNAVTSIAIL